MENANTHFDIDQLDVSKTSEEGRDVIIINPKTGLPTGLVITVKGAYSAKFQEIMSRQRQQEDLRNRNQVARAVAKVQQHDDTAASLAEVTLGWRTVTERDEKTGQELKSDNVLWRGGKQVHYSKNEAVQVYEDYPLIRGQVLAFVVDVTNFIPG